MELEYFYCNSCGHEEPESWVNYVRTVANGDVCECPYCGHEVLVTAGNINHH